MCVHVQLLVKISSPSLKCYSYRISTMSSKQYQDYVMNNDILVCASYSLLLRSCRSANGCGSVISTNKVCTLLLSQCYPVIKQNSRLSNFVATTTRSKKCGGWELATFFNGFKVGETTFKGSIKVVDHPLPSLTPP